jgi:hypothetical protein
VSEEEPEAEDRLGKDVQHSIGDDLSIETNHAGTISNTPDAVFVSTRR